MASAETCSQNLTRRIQTVMNSLPNNWNGSNRALVQCSRCIYDGHHYDRNGEANFDGHSDSRAHFYSIWPIGPFSVRTDQASYSSDDLKRKFGPLAGSRFGGGIVAGFTDRRSPYVNAIANDAGNGSDKRMVWEILLSRRFGNLL